MAVTNICKDPFVSGRNKVYSELYSESNPLITGGVQYEPSLRADRAGQHSHSRLLLVSDAAVKSSGPRGGT